MKAKQNSDTVVSPSSCADMYIGFWGEVARHILRISVRWRRVSTTSNCGPSILFGTHDFFCRMDSTRFSIEQHVATLPAEYRASVQHNLGQIEDMLRQVSSYTLRDDSRLAYRAAVGELPTWSPWMIAHEMACIQYISDTIPYQQYSQEYLRRLAKVLKDESGVDWKKIWHAVAELGPEILKIDLMIRHGVMLPDFVPASEASSTS